MIPQFIREWRSNRSTRIFQDFCWKEECREHAEAKQQ